jgi:mono/diheme cytochrome c family protein
VKRWCLIALGSLLLLGIGLPATYLLVGGVSARPEPPAVEVQVARWLRLVAIPSSANPTTNPLTLTPQMLSKAMAHFADHCASCHGNDGSGDTPLGRGLYPRAPDMRAQATQGLTDGELFYIIENGVRLTGMPAWGTPGKREESWELVHFIRRLPVLTAEEKADMRRFNPRGLDEWREFQEEQEFLRGGTAGEVNGEHGAH